MSGHRAIAVRGVIPPSTITRLMAPARAGDARETTTLVGFLAPLGDGVIAVGRVGDWTIAWDGISPIDETPEQDAERRRNALVEASRGGAALHWLTESTSGTDGFDWFVDGQRVRSWWQVEGDVIERVGNPVGGEPSAGLDEMERGDVDEWIIAGVVEALVAPWDALIGGEFRRVVTSA